MPRVALSFEPARALPEGLLSLSWEACTCTGQGYQAAAGIAGNIQALADLGKDFAWFCSGRGWCWEQQARGVGLAVGAFPHAGTSFLQVGQLGSSAPSLPLSHPGPVQDRLDAGTGLGSALSSFPLAVHLSPSGHSYSQSSQQELHGTQLRL